MKTHLVYIAVIAVLAYPAFLQAERSYNNAYDALAEARIGISKAEAADYLQVAEALPEHLKAPMPVRKGGK